MRFQRALLVCSLVAGMAAAGPALARSRHYHYHHSHNRQARHHMVRAYSYQSTFRFGTSSLVEEARRYIGTNPTGWAHDWCGKFMDLILRRTGHRGGGNLAMGYLHYGHRVRGPRVGAIAVMSRRGRALGGGRGGHVGVVAGVDANGNPIIISGNYRHRVARAVYPRGRIVAYVMPDR